MRVALISSAGKCGIAEHSWLLREHVQAADSTIEFSCDPAWLDPDAFDGSSIPVDDFDVVHLNYHRGLHSRWTPEKVRRNIPHPVVITFHDTYEIQPDLLPWDLLACPNVRAMVVHEPCDLSGTPALQMEHPAYTYRLSTTAKIHYWRQACPPPHGRGGPGIAPLSLEWTSTWRPTLGTLGFDFPWKNYDLLAEVTGELGWRLRIVGEVGHDRRAALRQKNQRTYFDGFLSTPNSVAALSSCDVTAFLYTCGNSGTSGAIRVGMTAGKPLLAAEGCRQFRDLAGDVAIQWIAPSARGLRSALEHYGFVAHRAGPGGYDLGLVALAHRESWTRQGAQYAALYREVARG